ncbi:hypothetical protein AMATHDRAFT_160515 [Amanita thiersii Skay4041]|uniref:HhH-GPD domain-containing protein n=1 Tax=Amanita thiersii Skay4041 TaxID=703135 RepID=A0A2A9NCN1_9AGAR|nr:hypothetical protein AMATHDRAFT_160515 [Amanita thiersii Skay4041]
MPSSSHQIPLPPTPTSLLPAATTTESESQHKCKKLKLHSSYSITSPFPNFLYPTPDEALQVFQILSAEHQEPNTFTLRPSLATATACGEVSNVLEAVISTILSQNTSSKNSLAAKANLDARFGRNNFAAIAEAPHADVVDAIRSGGLANKKAATIQKMLRSIKDKHGDYSLQHLTGGKSTAEEEQKDDGEGKKEMTNDEIMQELIAYDGVGPKTASCVLLFCLGRDSFAVDTHVFRLSRLLGWVPDKADRVLAQAHLDLRVPNELKYGLHNLMIKHGRACKGCKNPGSSSGDCILKTYLRTKNKTAK